MLTFRGGAFAALFVSLFHLLFAFDLAHARNESQMLTWLDARGRIALLSAFLKTGVNTAKENRLSIERKVDTGLRDCFVGAPSGDVWFKACTDLIFDMAKEGMTSDQRESVQRLWVMMQSSRKAGDWRSWAKLSVGMGLLGDKEAALESLRTARSKISENTSQTSRARQRLDFLENVYSILFNESVHSSLELEVILRFIEHGDPQLRPFVQRMLAVLENESHLGRRKLARTTGEDRSSALRNERWRLDLETDELVSLRERVVSESQYLDALPALSRFFEKYTPENSEWAAITSAVFSTSLTSSLLERKGGLLLGMDSWLAKQNTSVPIHVDPQGSAASRVVMVVKEFTRLLAHVISDVVRAEQESEGKEILDQLRVRLEAMSSSEARTLLTASNDENLQVVKKLRDQFVEIDNRLRRVKARLASVDTTSDQGQATTLMVRQHVAELAEIESTKIDLLSEFFSTSSAIDARGALESASQLKMLAQVRRTLDESRRLLSEGVADSGKYREDFFIDAQMLISQIEKSIRDEQLRRTKVTQSIAVELKKINAERDKLQTEMNRFLVDSSSDLRGRTLKQIETTLQRLMSRKREVEFEMQMVSSLQQETAKSERANLQKTRENLEILRRVRRENLEWRFAQ